MNVRDQLKEKTGAYLDVFGEPILYNGVPQQAIHDDGQTNQKETYSRGTADKEYFSLSAVDFRPEINDEITYCGNVYRIIRIIGENGGFIEVETVKNTSVFPGRW